MSKQINYDKLDTILMLASAEYMKKVTEDFLAAETDITLSEETERKITRMIRREKGKNTRRKVWKVLRAVLIAALATATVALAACMAHPEIREAIWKVVLTWGDKSVKIDFVPANPDGTTQRDPAGTSDTTSKPDEPIPDAPKSIEAVRVPGYMPTGWTTEGTLTSTSYMIDYYDNSGTNVITYWQTIIDTNSRGDADQADAYPISINGWDGVLLTYEDDPNAYVLYWQDYEYRYNFSGYFDSLDQLIRMAESVYVEAGAAVDEPTKSIKTIYAPGYMPEGYTTKSRITSMTYLLDYYKEDGENVRSFKQMIISSDSLGDAEDAVATEIKINGWNAVMFTYEDEPDIYSLFWQDSEYRYNFYGYFESYDELIRLAESVYATSSHPTPPAQSEQPDEPENPPKSNEKVIVPGYMPEGWTTTSYKSKSSFMLSYSNADGESTVTYKQTLISYNSEGDSREGTATDIAINGWDGVLISYAHQAQVYNLYWQDTEYRYSFYGQFDSLAQLLQMAESVYAEAGAQVDEAPKTIEEVNAPSYMPDGYTTVGRLVSWAYVLDYLDHSGEIIFTFTQIIINADSFGDAEGTIATELKINGWDGVLLTDENEPNIYTLYWQDSEYRYNFYGYFETVDELIRLAESVYE